MIPCKQIIREGNICRYTATANGEGKKIGVSRPHPGGFRLDLGST